MRAAAYNSPNRRGTHLPRKTVPHRPSFLIQFLIHCAELNAELTCTKQTAGPISNRQFFAFLKNCRTLKRRRAAALQKGKNVEALRSLHPRTTLSISNRRFVDFVSEWGVLKAVPNRNVFLREI